MSQPIFLPKEIIAQIDEILPCRSSAWPDQVVLVPVTAGFGWKKANWNNREGSESMFSIFTLASAIAVIVAALSAPHGSVLPLQCLS